jgi:hypothetical protein
MRHNRKSILLRNFPARTKIALEPLFRMQPPTHRCMDRCCTAPIDPIFAHCARFAALATVDNRPSAAVFLLPGNDQEMNSSRLNNRDKTEIPMISLDVELCLSAN